MRIISKTIGSWTIIQVEGTIDSIHTKVFVDALSDMVNAGTKRIILDLTEASFLSIGAIRYISQISQFLKSGAGQLALMGPNERIRRHIEVFVSWKALREISTLWELIPLQMETRLIEAEEHVLADSEKTGVDLVSATQHPSSSQPSDY